MTDSQKIMKISVGVMLIIFIIVLSIQIISLFRRELQLKAQLSEMTEREKSLTDENNKLEEQLQYLSKQQNLEKELKSKFNYRLPDEKMMIINQ